MKLIADWRAEFNRLWSIRLAVLMGLLGFADQLLPALYGVIPPIAYAGLSVLIILSRLVQQKPKDAAPPAA